MSGQKLGQILEKPCVRFRGHSFDPIFFETLSECLSSQYLGQV